MIRSQVVWFAALVGAVFSGEAAFGQTTVSVAESQLKGLTDKVVGNGDMVARYQERLDKLTGKIVFDVTIAAKPATTAWRMKWLMTTADYNRYRAAQLNDGFDEVDHWTHQDGTGVLIHSALFRKTPPPPPPMKVNR